MSVNPALPALNQDSKTSTQSLSADKQSNLSASKTQKGYSKTTIALFAVLAAAFIGLAYAEYKYRAVSFTISMLIGNPMLAFGIGVGLIIIGCAGYGLYVVFNKKESKAAKIELLEQQLLTVQERLNDCIRARHAAENQENEAQELLQVSYISDPTRSRQYAADLRVKILSRSEATANFVQAEATFFAAVKARNAALSS